MKRANISVVGICKQYKISRQGYYKAGRTNNKRRLEESLLMEMVIEIRKELPRIGGRKLYYLLGEDLAKSSIKIGRDKFFNFLRDEGLLIRPRKRYVTTTQSSHHYRTYTNLLESKQVKRKDQAWVSDITYIRTMQGFCYLALITDAYSRKIVGYDISDSLEMEGCKRALKMAIRQLGNGKELMHHSDRGVQYCCREYTRILKKNKIRISMADKGNCYQNAMAERVNGILKNEFYLDINFKTKRLAYKAVKQSIGLYNTKRPHESINLLTPNLKHAA